MDARKISAEHFTRVSIQKSNRSNETMKHAVIKLSRKILHKITSWFCWTIGSESSLSPSSIAGAIANATVRRRALVLCLFMSTPLHRRTVCMYTMHNQRVHYVMHSCVPCLAGVGEMEHDRGCGMSLLRGCGCQGDVVAKGGERGLLRVWLRDVVGKGAWRSGAYPWPKHSQPCVHLGHTGTCQMHHV